jgi:hypothetical protein
MNQRDTTAPVLRGGSGVIKVSLGAAAAGVILLLIGIFVDPARLAFAYLTAYVYLVSIAVSALLFLMICHAMRASWPVVVRRLNEAIVKTIPLLLLLFIPLLFGLRTLYPWLRPETEASPHALEQLAHKAPYLNLGFFLARTALYFVIWIVVGHLLCRWSEAKDREALLVNHRLYALSGGAIPLVGLALTFASFDWIMSLSPYWSSTMLPVYVFAGGCLGAIAALTLSTVVAFRRGLLPGVNTSHYYALGRLLLAFTVFWAYCGFFQLLIHWEANRPDEVDFYKKRIDGPWQEVSAVLVIVKFAIPFLLLLNYRIKRVPGALAAASVWLLAAHYIDMHWLLIPELTRRGFPYSFLDLGAILAQGGALVAYAVHRLRGLPLLPINDPRLPEALEYDSV